MTERFRRFAQTISHWTGSPWAFMAALALVLGWAVLGPIAHWSDTWQLWANTTTTIITFLMVFLLQNTQARDTAELKALLREIVEDVDEIDEQRAYARIAEEER